jgi:hypothetical protein
VLQALVLSLTFGLINHLDQNINLTFTAFIYYFILSSVGYIIGVTYLKYSSKLPSKLRYFSHAVSYLIIIIATVELNIGGIVASGDLCVMCAFIITLTNNGVFNSRYNKVLKSDS